MLLSYYDCEVKYGNQYQIKKALETERLYKIQPGIYAYAPQVSDLEIISFKYEQAVFTMDSAFYYHNLTDVIPDKYHLATSKDAYKIGSRRIKQHFHRDKTFSIGKTTILHGSTTIRIYNKERMLIELIRNKKSLPFDYYKGIIKSYRSIVQTMDIESLQKYIISFPKQNHIWEAIELEVM